MSGRRDVRRVGRASAVGAVRSVRAVLAVVGTVTLAAGALVACGGSGAAKGPRPLTDEQAGILSQVLAKDYEAGGATFTLAAPVRSGMALRLDGAVDWVKHRGHAQVTWEGNPAPGRVVEVFWSQDQVLERLPGLAEAMAGLSGRPVAWIVRPVDTTSNGLDRAIELVSKLASEQRDNPVLLRQRDGVGWLRADTLRTQAVDVYATSPKVRHWVSRADGRLLRVEAELGGFTQSTVVDLLSVGAQDVLGPRKDDVVAIDDVRSIYERLDPPPR